MSKSDPDPRKNSEPSESRMNLDLNPTASRDQGCLNESFQDEALEEQNAPGNSTVRSRVAQSGEQGHAKQDDRQTKIEQESLGLDEDTVEDREDERQKGFLERKYDTVCEFCRKHRLVLRHTIWAILLTGFLALVIAACALNFHRALSIFVVTLVTIFFVVWDHLMSKYEQRIDDVLSLGKRLLDRHWFWLKWVVWCSLILAVILWLALDTAILGQQQLISFGGLVMCIVLLFLFSKHRTRVSWRPVFGGIGLQFLLALLILRTRPGFVAFDWIGRQVQTFLEYTDAGAQFVFGEKFTDHFFAFKILPTVIFLNTVLSMLYYLGLMQWIIRKVGWLILVTIGSSPIESVIASGTIFFWQTELLLLVQPHLQHVTKSELHAIMTTRFATIARSLLGAYISFGVSTKHLLTTPIMSVPAALAVAKLFWPETEKPKTTPKDIMNIGNGDSRNILQAAAEGASSSIHRVTGIAANMIAFLALLSFVNSTLSWFGSMFDYPQLSFELICSYIFMPFSFMMGVDWQDSFMVAKLIGYKTFFSEFVAYEHLSIFIHLRNAAGPKFVNGVQQYMSIRSQTIATYALCGFANFGTLRRVSRRLMSVAPSRKRDIASGALRAMIAGNIATFIAACITGILSDTPVDINCHHVLESSKVLSNTTEVVSCCQDLFKSTVARGPNDVIPGGNFELHTLKSCCNLLKPPTLNCDWIPDIP